MRGAFSLLAAASAASTASAGNSQQQHRVLLASNPLANANLMPTAGAPVGVGSGSGSGLDRRKLDYNYLDDVSGYKLEFGRCHRVKVKENSDDDGGANMYNGRYHAQTMRFASFFLCGEASGGQCGGCDYTTEYVTDLDTYLEESVTYVQNYCGACANCGRRRRLEDEEGEEEENENEDGGGYAADVDCYTCQDQCELYSGGANEEVNYLDCQEAYVDEDGNQLYSAPTCDSDGDIVIDMFYDDECLIKHSVGNHYGFEYTAFQTVKSSCIDCNDANGVCGDLYGESFHCSDGSNLNGNVEEDEAVSVCKAYKEANFNRTYNVGKSSKGLWASVTIFVLALASCVAMGTYTYFVRHRSRPTPELASLDHGASGLS